MKLTEITPKPRTVLELYEGYPERWCQGISRSAGGARCCLMGALNFVYGYPRGEWYDSLSQAMVEFGHIMTVSRFNDTHTFDEVLALVRRAGV